MDTKTAARKWNVSVRTVQDYCRHKLIPGAVLDDSQRYYLIPDDAKKPYFPHTYANRTASDDRFDVLNALYMDCHLTAERLNSSHQRFTDMIETLSQAKLIILRHRKDARDVLANYRLTNKGIDIMEGYDPKKALLAFLRKHIPGDDT